METSQPLKIGFVGAGMISQYHLQGWREVEGADVVAICDPNSDNARKRAEEFGIAEIHPDLETMLAAVDLDAVDIATPVGTHAPLVRQAADRGVHIMCQKPMTSTVAEAAALIDYVGERVRFMIHENYRFRPEYDAVRRWIAEGRIGRPSQVRMAMRSSGMSASKSETPWLIARQPYLATMPRLIIFETLIHHLDTLRSIVGELKVLSSVTARLNASVAGEDTALIVMRSHEGVLVTLDGTFCAPGYPSNIADRLEVVGDRATLLFDDQTLSLVGDAASSISFQAEGRGEGQECFTACVQNFVDGLRTGTSFATDRIDNLKTLQLMESCYEMESGRVEPSS